MLPLWTFKTPEEAEEWADPEKREAALRFEERLEHVREDEAYREAKDEHRER